MGLEMLLLKLWRRSATTWNAIAYIIITIKA